ncbi:hypothetical protein DFJ73DRAFT_918489 [Zopfochytrium polystomum]|nr:hypothetical protein DFJ73DRAFT_918489 [Zopfochytrium polystomum]
MWYSSRPSPSASPAPTSDLTSSQSPPPPTPPPPPPASSASPSEAPAASPTSTATTTTTTTTASAAAASGSRSSAPASGSSGGASGPGSSPRDLGHPPEYFDDLLAQAEADAYRTGLRWGIASTAVAAAGSAVAVKVGPRIQGARFGLYHSLLVTALVGLVTSQTAIHFSYILDHQLIKEQQRREAFWRAEVRRKADIRRMMEEQEQERRTNNNNAS